MSVLPLYFSLSVHAMPHKMTPFIIILALNGTLHSSFNSQWFVDNFSLPIVKDFEQWFIDEQIGRISFLTLRGAGHEVTKYRPEKSLKMFPRFVHNKTGTIAKHSTLKT